MIFLVGDKPSAKNKDPKIPFVGTKSYKTLLSWIPDLEIDITSVVLANTEHVKRIRPDWAPDVETPSIFSEIISEDKVIALGNSASDYLSKLEISHFKLPHPSGLNRKLNDKKYMKTVLKECKNYLKAS